MGVTFATTSLDVHETSPNLRTWKTSRSSALDSSETRHGRSDGGRRSHVVDFRQRYAGGAVAADLHAVGAILQRGLQRGIAAADRQGESSCLAENVRERVPAPIVVRGQDCLLATQRQLRISESASDSELSQRRSDGAQQQGFRSARPAAADTEAHDQRLRASAGLGANRHIHEARALERVHRERGAAAGDRAGRVRHHNGIAPGVRRGGAGDGVGVRGGARQVGAIQSPLMGFSLGALYAHLGALRARHLILGSVSPFFLEDDDEPQRWMISYKDGNADTPADVLVGAKEGGQMHRRATAIRDFYRHCTFTIVPEADHELWHPHYLQAIKDALNRLAPTG